MRDFKGAGRRGRLCGWVTRRPLSLNVVALALREAQSVPRGKAGEGVALVAAADGGIVGRGGVGGGGQMGRNRPRPWANRHWP